MFIVLNKLSLQKVEKQSAFCIENVKKQHQQNKY